MSLTDDMCRVKKAADDIAGKREHGIEAPRTISEEMEGTYYSKRTEESSNPENVLKEYVFSSPVEIKKELEQMWAAMGKEEMQAFLPVCMASLAKNRPGKLRKEEEHTVSPYIYEF